MTCAAIVESRSRTAGAARLDGVSTPLRERRRLAAFFALVLLVSWGAWVAAAVGGAEWTSFPTVVLFVLGGAGPFIATVVLVRGTLAARERRRFVQRVLDPRPVLGRWGLVVVGIACVPALSARWLHGVLQDDAGPWGGFAWPSVGALAGIVLFNLLASVAEEPGWRGYAYDRAREIGGARAASLGIGVFWMVWHVPLYFVEGTFQNGHGFGSLGFFVYSLALPPTAVLFGWVVARTGWSITAAVLAHVLDNAAGEILDLSADAQVYRMLILVVLAVLAWWRWDAGRDARRQPGRVMSSGTTQASNSSALT